MYTVQVPTVNSKKPAFTGYSRSSLGCYAEIQIIFALLMVQFDIDTIHYIIASRLLSLFTNKTYSHNFGESELSGTTICLTLVIQKESAHGGIVFRNRQI